MGWGARPAESIGARGQDASGLLGDPLVDGVVDGREDGLALLLLLRHGSDAAERGDRDVGQTII